MNTIDIIIPTMWCDENFIENLEKYCFYQNVQNILNSNTVSINALSIANFVKHGGTGTLTVGVGQFDGQTLNIRSNGTMTISWSAGSQGISLGSAAQLASGVYDADAGFWYFSETVTS